MNTRVKVLENRQWMLTEDSRVVYSGDEWDDRLKQEAPPPEVPPPPPVTAVHSLSGNFSFGTFLAAFKTMFISVSFSFLSQDREVDGFVG